MTTDNTSYSFGNPYLYIEATNGDLIDFPCSPAFVAIYAARGLTPQLPKGFPLRVTTPAPWERKLEWPAYVEDYDPAQVEVGENSPLWDGIRHLWPSEMQKKEVQQKLAEETDNRNTRPPKPKITPRSKALS